MTMSDNVLAHDAGVANDVFGMSDNTNLFQRVMSMRDGGRDRSLRETQPVEPTMTLFKTVRPNIVQSIRAFRVPDLAMEAARLGHHFLYAWCANAQSKAEVLETIATEFLFPRHFGKNYDALYDCLTDMVDKAGTQPGFVIVLEGVPTALKFDKDARETMLDVFREAAEFWAERKVAFRVFYSFAA
jgi:RNAse (barnase) inhibitor barstar